jgi:O-antigen/teichoic acid export membrane protein
MRRLIPLLLIGVLLLCTAMPAAAKTQLSVFYAGPAGSVRTALELAGFDVLTDAGQAQVLVLNGVIPAGTHAADHLAAGKGMLLILGADLTPADLGFALGDSAHIESTEAPLSLEESPNAPSALAVEAVWNSAPQVRARLALSGANLTPLAQGHPGGELVLGGRAWDGGALYVLTPFLDSDNNPQIQEWAYFNYLVYALVMRAAGLQPLSFADYPGSPVPHAGDRVAILSSLAGLLIIVSFAFVIVRRYSRAHPEALDSIVANRAAFESRSAQAGWERVGFHRPLGGFLLSLMLGLILFVPLIIYQNLVLPVYILPSAQALGLWGRVLQFFNVAWLFFDMGTSIAFIKYLSQYRVHDPRRGIQYGQVFVWWQMLSGAVQVAMVVGLASTVVPRTTYALYAWGVIIHSLIQLPGWFLVMNHALKGFQRSDHAQFLELAWQVLMPMAAQPVVVALMYAWGKANPAVGGAMGGLLGMGLAAYVAEALTFVLGFWLYRRMGYSARVLFLAHFDWEIVRTSFGFGVFEMLGSLAWAGGQAAEIWITQARLVNYAEVWGNWILAQNFVFAFNVLQTLNNGVMPAISEAISNGKRALSQYYSAQSYRYGGMISAFIGAVLLAVADRFILGASGPEFVRAASYAIPLIIWGAVQYPSWVGDTVQLGSNRPYLKSLLVFGEQVIRVTLALLLLARLQVNALILAYFAGLLTKGVVAYLINHRLCYPQRFYFWSSLAAPLLAGGVHYLFLRGLTGLVWQADQMSSVLIFFIGILPSFPVYAFLYGLFGGWDAGTLAELREAIPFSGFMRRVTWIFYAASALGCRISPLHGRFPLTLREEALREAAQLTTEKVPL